MLVLKFGGTSVQDAQAIERLIEITLQRAIPLQKPDPRLVVVSALSKVTDTLVEITAQIQNPHKEQGTAQSQTLVEDLKKRHLQLCSELRLSDAIQNEITEIFRELGNFVRALSEVGEVSPRSRDRILATGEILSSKIVAQTFFEHARLPRNPFIDAREFMKTQSVFGEAPVDFEATNLKVQTGLLPFIQENILAVTGGFIGSDSSGATTTLGRGGSDYSASVLGAALGARAIEIWTDVDGILTADPRIVPEAKRILKMSFAEASELAYFGAKVLHPATIFPAVSAKIPVWVFNSKNPEHSGTEITHQTESFDTVVKAITGKRGVTLIHIYSTRMLGASGFLKSVFDEFARLQVSVDLISTSEVSVSMTLDSKIEPKTLEKLRLALSEFSVVQIEEAKASIAVVGQGIRNTSNLGGRIFGALRDINISMISMGASEVNLGFVVDDKNAVKAIQKLHTEFFPLN